MRNNMRVWIEGKAKVISEIGKGKVSGKRTRSFKRVSRATGYFQIDYKLFSSRLYNNQTFVASRDICIETQYIYLFCMCQIFLLYYRISLSPTLHTDSSFSHSHAQVCFFFTLIAIHQNRYRQRCKYVHTPLIFRLWLSVTSSCQRNLSSEIKKLIKHLTPATCSSFQKSTSSIIIQTLCAII